MRTANHLAPLVTVLVACAPTVVLGPTDASVDATASRDVAPPPDAPPMDLVAPIDTPAATDVSSLDRPDVPGVSDVPEVSDVPDVPDVRDVPDVPDVVDAGARCPGADLQRDPTNCGACGVRCCGGWCFNGVCGTEGPPGTLGCNIPMAGCVGPSPVNASSDPAHCGGCNIACAASQVCSRGECLTPDAGVVDAPPADTGTPTDAGEPACTPGSGATCAAGSSCQCCPAGGPRSTCLCTTTCRVDADCRDPSRPVCSVNPFGSPTGLCLPPSLHCAWGAVCAAADTPIATPEGERRIDAIRVGDLVYGQRDGALAPVRVVRVSQTRVYQHTLVRVTLRNGRTVAMSAGHPTVDGLRFFDLAPGASLGGVEVIAREVVPYDGAATHDLLTDGDKGAYVAAGVLVGSTLREPAPRALLAR